MAKASRGGDRPTGPNKSTQGKMLAPHASPARKGNENGNGSWREGYCNDCASIKVAPQHGTRKSF